MAQVAPVELPYNIKTLWFDPCGLEIQNGDKLVVQTARGMELGTSVGGVIEVSDDSVQALKTKLQPVKRIATAEDIARAEDMEARSREAMPVFKEMARGHNEDIHPVSVEFMLDGDKAIFYFEAEERVDFRNLVRDLASHFHVRIDMRQIGVRDEARIVGGIGHCGQVVCCKRLGGEFKPVSIRMAKNQDLSLNPKKISGLCGRLMCCLRYEDDVYKEFKQLAPKVGAQVITPDGDGKVVELCVPKKTVSIRVGDNKPVDVPLDAICDISENQKSCAVNEEEWAEANEQASMAMYGGTSLFDFSTFTGEDKLGKAIAVHNERPKRDEPKSQEEGKRKRARRRSSGNGNPSEGKRSGSAPRSKPGSSDRDATRERKPRRRSTKIHDGSTRTETFGDADAAKNVPEDKRESNRGQAKSKANGRRRRSSSGSKEALGTSKGNGPSKPKGSGKQGSGSLRPGHKSSALSHDDASRSDGGKGQEGSGSSAPSGTSHRRRRRKPSNPVDKLTPNPHDEGNR